MKRDIALFKEAEIFQNLTEEQVGKVLSRCGKVTYGAGEVIMREGELGDRMYIIREGKVQVIKRLILDMADDEKDQENRNKIFTTLTTGQVFGEIVLLEELRRTATVVAQTNCELYELKKDDFFQLAKEDVQLGFRILLNLGRIVSARLRKADEDTVKLTTVLSMILKET